LVRRTRRSFEALRQKLIRRLASPLEQLAPSEGGVALTFDDGPDPVFTPALLDILKDRSVHATFFLVGEKAERVPEIVQRMMAEGHAIGSHSLSHPDMWTVKFGELWRQYARGRRSVEQLAAQPVSLFRPPKGWSNVRSALVCRVLGMQPTLWNKTGDDWKVGVTCDDIVAAIGPLRDRDVVLLHDSIERPLAASVMDRTPTLEAVGVLVDSALEQGLRFVTL
jgi:peptidoglycan/xylan/chitin deacetylase (PgdA/CDA1 family)